MRRAVVAASLACSACGRIGFGPVAAGEAGDGDALPDGFGTFNADARSVATPPAVVSDANAMPECPQLAWTGSGWALAWLDKRDIANGEIYFTLADASGAKLGPDLRVTNNPAVKACPRMAWNSTSLLIAWPDRRLSTQQIFGQFVTPAATLSGGALQITTGNNNKSDPLLAWNGTGYDLAYSEQRGAANDDLKWAPLSSGAVAGTSVTVLTDNIQIFDDAIVETNLGAVLAAPIGAGPITYTDALVAGGTVRYSTSIATSPIHGRISVAWTGVELAALWIDELGTTTSPLEFAKIDPATGAPSGTTAVAYSSGNAQMIYGGGRFGTIGVSVAAQPNADAFALLALDGTLADAPLQMTGIGTSLAFDGTHFGCANVRYTPPPAVQLQLITPM